MTIVTPTGITGINSITSLVNDITFSTANGGSLTANGLSFTNLQTSSINGGPISGTRNRIINGDMRIDQRNNGASVATGAAGASFFGVDRWAVFVSTANKLTIQQNSGSVTPPPGFSNYIGIISSSAYTAGAGETHQLYQNVEGFNSADFGWGSASAQAITLSFWVRSSLTGTFGGGLTNQAQNRSYPFTYTISAANTWEQKTLTIPGDTTGTWLTNNLRGITAIWDLGTGANFKGTAGSWSGSNFYSATGVTSVIATNGATFYITGVQLEAGTVATPFERRSFGQELALCQRYYQILYTGSWRRYVANVDRDQRQMAVSMRANPTLTFSASGSNLNANSSNATSTHLTIDLQFSAGGTGVIDLATLSIIGSAEL